jgi:uncharacterized lipoprotein YmbA
MKKTLPLFLALALAACAEDSPPNHYYLLTSTAPASHIQSIVTVSQVIIPAYLDRAQIVRHNGAELSMNEFERWGEGFDSMIRRTLSADLAALPATGSVRTARVVIDDFAGAENGDVTLTAHWTFPRGDKIAHTYNFTHTLLGAESDNATLAAAMSELLKQLAASIAESR